MRRRWVAWTGGFVLVAALTTVGLALFLGRSDAPFRFLDGHKPVPLPDRLKGVKGVGIFYSFKADWHALTATARKELLARGYTERNNKSYRDSVFIFNLEEPDVPPNEELAVDITRGFRLTEDPFEMHLADGWVVVWITGEPRQTVFDRIRSWMGL